VVGFGEAHRKVMTGGAVPERPCAKSLKWWKKWSRLDPAQTSSLAMLVGSDSIGLWSDSGSWFAMQDCIAQPAQIQVGCAMFKSHFSPRTVETTRTFVQGSFLGIIGLISVITAATLIYVWFFT
jgi:hypothetical protein